MYTHVNLRTYTETEVWKVLEVYLLNSVQKSHLTLGQTRLIEKTGWPLIYIVWSKSKRVTSRKLTGLAMRIPQRPFLRFFSFKSQSWMGSNLRFCKYYDCDDLRIENCDGWILYTATYWIAVDDGNNFQWLKLHYLTFDNIDIFLQSCENISVFLIELFKR